MPALSQAVNSFELHLSSAARDLLQRAASLRGQDVKEFATAVLVESAQRVVQQGGQTVLSDQDRDIFLALLESESEPNETLKQAAKRYRECQV